MACLQPYYTTQYTCTACLQPYYTFTHVQIACQICSTLSKSCIAHSVRSGRHGTICLCVATPVTSMLAILDSHRSDTLSSKVLVSVGWSYNLGQTRSRGGWEVTQATEFPGSPGGSVPAAMLHIKPQVTSCIVIPVLVMSEPFQIC